MGNESGEIPATVVEIGVGENPWLKYVAKSYLGGVDLEKARVLYADKRSDGLRWLKKHGTGAELIQFSGEKIPLEDESVKIVSMFNLFGGKGEKYVSRGEKPITVGSIETIDAGLVAEEAHRVVESGGLCIVVELAPGFKADSAEELKEKFKSAGFQLADRGELKSDSVLNLFGFEGKGFSKGSFAFVFRKLNDVENK